MPRSFADDYAEPPFGRRRRSGFSFIADYVAGFSASAAAFDAGLRCMNAGHDLLIFDTTCFSSGSGRIRRVLGRAHELSIPLVMARSHTKLDSLGAEYGRLGSVAFVGWENVSSESKLRELPAETRFGYWAAQRCRHISLPTSAHRSIAS